MLKAARRTGRRMIGFRFKTIFVGSREAFVEFMGNEFNFHRQFARAFDLHQSADDSTGPSIRCTKEIRMLRLQPAPNLAKLSFAVWSFSDPNVLPDKFSMTEAGAQRLRIKSI